MDTNVLLQLYGTTQSYYQITDALQQGRLEIAVSNEILLEYEETLPRLSGQRRWEMVWRFLDGVSRLHNNVLYAEPHFRFAVISEDPDDNKFVDCAIVVQADYILTSDHHFDVLQTSGYRPKPIHPQKFIASHL